MPTFHAIVAMSENRTIALNGKIPWRLPEDFRWFKYKDQDARRHSHHGSQDP